VKPRLVLVGVAVVSMLSLTGCAHQGDTAATVGNRTVTKADVNLLSKFQCDLIKQAGTDPSQQAQVVPVDKVRTYIATALINNALDAQLTHRAKVRVAPNLYSSDLTQAETSAKSIPAKDRKEFIALALASIKSGYAIQILAGRTLAASGVSQPTQDQIVKAVTQLRDAFRKTVKIDVDPVYGLSKDGSTIVDASLSKAVSSFANSTVAAQPGQAFLGELAANQKCG
jgi:hypothetical protein